MVSTSILDSFNFSKSFYVERRSLIADHFQPGYRCGISALTFANGDWCCSQSVDVTRRFVQHTNNHPDIT